MAPKFSHIISLSSLLFAFIAVLTTLLINIQLGDNNRRNLLARNVRAAAHQSAAGFETIFNQTFATLRGASRSLVLLSRMFNHDAPWVQKEGANDWSMSPIVERTYMRVLHIIEEQFFDARLNTDVQTSFFRWSNGIAATGNFRVEPQQGGLYLYRPTAVPASSDPAYSGVWTGINGLEKGAVNHTISSVWNLTTLEHYPERPYELAIGRRHCTKGYFWNLSVAGARGVPDAVPVPVFAQKIQGREGLGMQIQLMAFRDAASTASAPFMNSGTFIATSVYSERLRGLLLQNQLGLAASADSSNTSFAFLVDRNHGVVMSQSAPAPTFVRFDFIPGVTKPGKHCFVFAPARAMACIKNISTAPDFSLLRSLLLAGNSSLEGAALDEGLTMDGNGNPVLSDPDVGGDLAINTIIGDDGVEYYATVITLALPSASKLRLSLITFTPRDLFAAEALRARDTAIGVAVAVSLVVILLMLLFLLTISSAVSELAEQMSDPLALLPAPPGTASAPLASSASGNISAELSMESSGESIPTAAAAAGSASRESNDNRSSTRTNSAVSTNSSVSANILSMLSNVEEIRLMQENFDFCMDRIRQLRGFMSKASINFMTGQKIVNFGSSGSGPLSSISGGSKETSSGNAASAEFSTDDEDPHGAGATFETAEEEEQQHQQQAHHNKRRVRFRDELTTATEIPARSNGNDDDDGAADDGQSHSKKSRLTLENLPPSAKVLEKQKRAKKSRPETSIASPQYPLQRRRRSKSAQRFACVSISFPFVRAALEKMSSGKSGDSLTQKQQLEQHQTLFDMVAATAEAAHRIVSHAHATSIEDLSLLGDECMCCLRMRQNARRSLFLIGVLNECIEAAFALQKKFVAGRGKKQHHQHNQRHDDDATEQREVPVKGVRRVTKKSAVCSSKTVFVAAGVSSGMVVPLNHSYQPSELGASAATHLITEEKKGTSDDADRQHPQQQSPQSASASSAAAAAAASSASAAADGDGGGTFQLRPLSLLGRAIGEAHTIQRTMATAAGSLIYDHEECNILVRDAPRIRVPRPFQPNKSISSPSSDEPGSAAASGRQRRHRNVYALPFAIGIAEDAMPAVEPDFVQCTAVHRPAAYENRLLYMAGQKRQKGSSGGALERSGESSVSSGDLPELDEEIFSFMRRDRRHVALFRIVGAELATMPSAPTSEPLLE